MPFQFLGNALMMGGEGLSGIGGMPLPIGGASLDIDFARNAWSTPLGPETLVNGTFDTNLSGWTAIGVTANVIWSAGQASVTGDGTTTQTGLQQTVTTVPGATYQFSFSIAQQAMNMQALNGSTIIGGSGSGAVGVFNPGPGSFTFVAVSNATIIRAYRGSASTALLDNFSVRQVNPQALGPNILVNGTFDTNLTGWMVSPLNGATITWDAGRAKFAGGGTAGNGTMSQAFSVIPGVLYEISFDFSTSPANTHFGVSVGNTAGGTHYLDAAGASLGTSGVKTFRFIPTQTTIYVGFYTLYGTSTQVILDNVSVKEVNAPVSSLLTTVRASTGMAQRLDGSWVEFAANEPRITDRGLLVEEARTNLALWSNAFGNAVWNAVPGATVADDAVLAPDNTMTASRMTGTLADTTRRQLITAATGVYTFSVFLKLPDGAAPLATQIYLRHTTNDMAAITITDRWQRFVVTTTTTATTVTLQIGGASTWGIGREIHAWGGQLELGAFATSPIKTTGAAVTRAIDNVYTPTGAWLNQAAGTLYVEGNCFDPVTPTCCFVSLDDGTANERIQVRRNSSTYLNTIVVDGGVGTANVLGPSPTMPLNVSVKNALAYALNDINAASVGLLGVADTAATLPTVTRLTFGSGLGVPLNGYLQRTAYYPTRLSNADLQTLTA